MEFIIIGGRSIIKIGGLLLWYDGLLLVYGDGIYWYSCLYLYWYMLWDDVDVDVDAGMYIIARLHCSIILVPVLLNRTSIIITNHHHNLHNVRNKKNKRKNLKMAYNALNRHIQRSLTPPIPCPQRHPTINPHNSLARTNKTQKTYLTT